MRQQQNWLLFPKSHFTRNGGRTDLWQGPSKRTATRLSQRNLNLSGWLDKYYQTHKPDCEHENSQVMSSTFKELATSTNLVGSEVHNVKEVWTGWRNLKATHHAAKALPKNIHFFQVVLPTKSPKIMDLSGNILHQVR